MLRMVRKGGVFTGWGACVGASATALMADLSWDDFRYVKAIAERRSLASAAEALGVNHSTVFRRLAHIEDRLGSRLFERNRAGYALTPWARKWSTWPSEWGRTLLRSSAR